MASHDTNFKAIQMVENGIVSLQATQQWAVSLLRQGCLAAVSFNVCFVYMQTQPCTIRAFVRLGQQSSHMGVQNILLAFIYSLTLVQLQENQRGEDRKRDGVRHQQCKVEEEEYINNMKAVTLATSCKSGSGTQHLICSSMKIVPGRAYSAQKFAGSYTCKQFPGKPAAEVSYKNKLTYRSVPVLSTMRVPRVPQSDACAPDF